MSNHESECVALKRRGQEFVRKLVAGKSREERLKYWSEQTASLRAWQQAKRTGATQLDPAAYLFREDSGEEAELLDAAKVEEQDSMSHSV